MDNDGRGEIQESFFLLGVLQSEKEYCVPVDVKRTNRQIKIEEEIRQLVLQVRIPSNLGMAISAAVLLDFFSTLENV